jgi:hypothetical protein
VHGLPRVIHHGQVLYMACAILRTNRDVLERGARALLEKETLDEAAIRALATQLQSIESALPPNVRRMN